MEPWKYRCLRYVDVDVNASVQLVSTEMCSCNGDETCDVTLSDTEHFHLPFYNLIFNVSDMCLNLESYNLKLILYEFEIMLNCFILEKNVLLFEFN